LLDIVQKMVHLYERDMPRPWSFDGSGPFVERLLAQIVGFRIEIQEIDGKWKLNQNHPVERRMKVVSALQKQGHENAQDIAEMIQAMLPNSDEG
jgi:transcriptional regulator